MSEDKERRYDTLETIMLNFTNHTEQYSALFHPEDKPQIITQGHEVRLRYQEKEYHTIDRPDLIQLSLEKD